MIRWRLSDFGDSGLEDREWKMETQEQGVEEVGCPLSADGSRFAAPGFQLPASGSR